MNRKISIGTGLAFLFIVIAATIATTMKVSMSVYNNLIDDLANRVGMYDSIAEVDELVRKQFFGDVDSDLVDASLARGYIAGLNDPASFYLTPEEYVVYYNRLLGKMSGTGITCTFNPDTGYLYITAVAKNSPAEAVGIKAGDEIIKVGDETVTKKNYKTLQSNLIGAKMSNVSVTYLRGKEKKTENLVMDYSEATVSSKMNGDVGIISINAFYENTIPQFKDEIDNVTKEGARALIFDVRNCSEGSISYAAKVLDILVPVATDGTAALATAIGKDGKTIKTFPSDSDCVTLPMIVLVNENTAGPAELFACDLRDFGKAELIGMTTKGIGTMQQVHQFSDGSAVVLTVAEIIPYRSESYNKVGLTPDYEILMTTAQTNQIGIMADDDDPHIQKALKLLS
ncbi:MAG: PDZ domain-containing protein [Ruminococcaceae bacterium]|nr:PDZ domain-containing protein [Oscillospiraceae bacterium]